MKNQQVINVDAQLATPIYRQIIDSVYQAIEKKQLKVGDGLPSVNTIIADFSIARGSIFKAYDELRSAGVIDSIPGKGFFVTNTSQTLGKHIFLLMSTFNPYRELFYNEFVRKLKSQASVDLYFHHHNIDVFETLIQNHASHYNTFVVMPEIHKRTAGILKKFDGRNLFIMDSGHKEFGRRYPGVTQNYEDDLFNFLSQQAQRLVRYQRVILLFSGNMRNFDVIKGFERFFKNSHLPAVVVKDTDSYKPQHGDLTLVMDDNDLVPLILYAKEKNWKLGEDIGIISYHETPLKRIIANGISVITPDFAEMGSVLADLIINGPTEDHIQNKFLFLDRKSF